MALATSANLAQMGKGLVHLNKQYEAGVDDDLLAKKYNELAEASAINMTRLITDRHYLQGLADFMGLFSADLHEKRRWLKRVASVNPVVSIYSSFRRGVTRGLEGAKIEKLQPTVPSERPEEYYYQYKDGEPVLDKKGKKVLKPKDELVPKTAFEQVAYQAVGEITRLFNEGMREVTPGYGTKRASRTIMGHIKAHPATIYSDRLNLDPWKVTSNLVNNMFNPVPAITPSGDPVELKLAELESNIKSPSQLYSIPLGNQPGTRIGYGVLALNDEQKYYLQDKWIELNTKGAISKLVKRWNKLGNKAPSPQIQRNILERFLNVNLKMARIQTISHFKDLSARRTHIIKSKGRGLSNPVMPTTGLMNNLIPQTTNILPQPQG